MLPSIDAGQCMVVADLKGSGIIRHIHTTCHQNPDLNAPGIVLVITFDDTLEPAVCARSLIPLVTPLPGTTVRGDR